MKKRILSVLLVLTLLFGLAPLVSREAEAAGERGQWDTNSLKGSQAGDPYLGYSSIADLDQKAQKHQALSRYTFKGMECTTYATARAEEKLFGTRNAAIGGFYAKDLPKEIGRTPVSNGKVTYNIEVYVADGKNPESSNGKYIVSNSYACFDSSSKFSNVYAGHVIFIEEVAVYNGVKYVYYTEGGKGFDSWEVKRETFDSFWNNGKGYTGSVMYVKAGSSGSSGSGSSNASAALADGWYTLAPKCAPGARLDVTNASTADKANVQIYAANDTNAQMFYFKSVGNGYYTIKARHSGKLVDVYGANTASGTNVHQYTDNGTDAQKWRIYDAGGGYVSIAPKINTGLRLDVQSGKSANGTNVQVYTSNGTDAQKWKLVGYCPSGHTKDRFLYYGEAHPHYACYRCKVCGTAYEDKSASQIFEDCETCYPELKCAKNGHTRGAYQYYGATHPHPDYYKCKVCGEIYRDDSTSRTYEECAICNPKLKCEENGGHTRGEVKLTIVDHPHYSWCACQVCGKVYVDTSTPGYREDCEECNPPKPEPTPEAEVTIDDLTADGITTESAVLRGFVAVENGTLNGITVEIEKAAGGAMVGGWHKSCRDTVYALKADTSAYTTLEPETRYRWRIVAYYGDDNMKTGSNWSYFTTLPEPEPQPTNSGFGNFTRTNTYYNGLFRDVSREDWFRDSVVQVYELGLMKGTGQNRFSPGNNITIGEAVTLAARIHSIYNTGRESFVTYDGGNWYDPYVDYARQNGIIYENYEFSRPATREVFAHILAAVLPGSGTSGWRDLSGTFRDANDITYSGDVARLVDKGIIRGIQGTDGIYFKPHNTITRSEVAAMVQRLVSG